MKLFWFLLVCLYSSFSCAIPLTEAEQDWITNNRDFTFYNDNYNSRLFFIENGVQKGLYSDLIKDINKKLNTNFHIKVENLDDLIAKFDNVDTGAYFDFAKTEERDYNYNFIPTLYRISIKVFYKNENLIHDLVSLNNKKIGLVDEWYSTNKFILKYEDDINYIPVRFTGLNEMMVALNNGEIDAFIADTQAISEKSYFTHDLPRLDSLYTSFAVTKDQPELHSILIKYFNELSALEIKELVKNSREENFIYFFKNNPEIKGLSATVGYGFEEFPASYLVNGEYEGIAPALFDSIETIFKDTVTFTQPKLGECLEYDVLLSTFYNECIAEHYYLTKPYYSFELSVFNKLEGSFISRISDVNYSTLGILKNAHYYDYIKNNTSNVTMVFFDTDRKSVV